MQGTAKYSSEASREMEQIMCVYMSREREERGGIYCKERVHMVMESDKSQESAGWRPRKS